MFSTHCLFAHAISNASPLQARANSCCNVRRIGTCNGPNVRISMSLTSSTHVTVIACSRPALIVLSPRIPVPRRKHFFRLFSAVHVSPVWIQSLRTLSIKVAFRLMPEILTCSRVFPLLCVLQFLADWAAVYGLIDEAASLRGVRPSVLRAVASGRGCIVRWWIIASCVRRVASWVLYRIVDKGTVVAGASVFVAHVDRIASRSSEGYVRAGEARQVVRS